MREERWDGECGHWVRGLSGLLGRAPGGPAGQPHPCHRSVWALLGLQRLAHACSWGLQTSWTQWRILAPSLSPAVDQHWLQREGSDPLPHRRGGLRLLTHTQTSHSHLPPPQFPPQVCTPDPTRKLSEVGVPARPQGPGCHVKGWALRLPARGLTADLAGAGRLPRERRCAWDLLGPLTRPPAVNPKGPHPHPPCHFRPFPVPGIHTPLLADG